MIANLRAQVLKYSILYAMSLTALSCDGFSLFQGINDIKDIELSSGAKASVKEESTTGDNKKAGNGSNSTTTANSTMPPAPPAVNYGRRAPGGKSSLILG